MKTFLQKQSLSYEILWESMKIILERFINSVNREIFMEEVLDTIIELFGANRGVILTTDINHGENFIVCTRDKKSSVNTEKREEISRTVIKQAQTKGKTVVFHPGDDDDFSKSMKVCKIFTAIATPLYATFSEGEKREIRGILYLDFRSLATILTQKHLEFFESTAHLLSVVIEQKLKLNDAERNIKRMRSENKRDITLSEIIAPKSMSEVRELLRIALSGNMPILITGESGTGKTILANAIAHAWNLEPVVRATLGFSDDLNTITSELFGHLKGAFSGAISKRTGLVEQAHGGVIILDEILNLPLQAQQLLLDFTQFGTYRPLGWNKKEPKFSNVRIISVTNGNIEQAIKDNKFRMDLYYRIAAVKINIPPLRERREDIPMLVLSFLRRKDPEISWFLDMDLRSMLVSKEFEWPGNLRQLEAMVGMARESALLENPYTHTLKVKHFFGNHITEIIGKTAVPSEFKVPEITFDNISESAAWLKEKKSELEKFEKELIKVSLKKYNGTVSYVARALEIPRTSLLSRMHTLGIKRPDKP